MSGLLHTGRWSKDHRKSQQHINEHQTWNLLKRKKWWCLHFKGQTFLRNIQQICLNIRHQWCLQVWKAWKKLSKISIVKVFDMQDRQPRQTNVNDYIMASYSCGSITQQQKAGWVIRQSSSLIKNCLFIQSAVTKWNRNRLSFSPLFHGSLQFLLLFFCFVLICLFVHLESEGSLAHHTWKWSVSY